MSFNFDQLELRLVQDLGDLWDLQAWMGERREGWLGLDVETTGLNKARDRVRTYQMGDEHKGWTVPLDEFRTPVRELLAAYDRPVCYHNAVFDLGFNEIEGIRVNPALVDDTMLMSHVINPVGGHALKLLATRFVDKRASHGQALLHEQMSKHRWDWDTVPVDLPAFWLYSALDTCLTAALAPHLWKRMTPGYVEAYEIEMACVHVLARAEVAGLAVDPTYLDLATEELTRRLAHLEPQLGTLNPNADRQVIEFLQARGYHFVKTTDKGRIATDDEVLTHAAISIPEAQLIRDARKYRRLRDTYVGGLRERGEPEASGLLKVCCNHRPVGAVTSRMSITEPPLQQLPRGRYIRDAFVARPGCKLVSADYAGMEMRVLASLANEEAMIAAFNRGEDMHNFVASELYGPGFTKEQRSVCKNAGFALIYGAGIEQFSRTARISVAQGTEFMARYAQLFPRVVAHMEENTALIRSRIPARGKNGWIGLRYGRRIPVPGDEAYKGTNYEIQGSCAQVLKMKMVEMDSAGLGPFMRLAVHDQVLCEAPDDQADEVKAIMDAVMPDRHSFRVVLEAEAEIARSWGEFYVGADYPPLLTAPPYWAWDVDAAQNSVAVAV